MDTYALTNYLQNLYEIEKQAKLESGLVAWTNKQIHYWASIPDKPLLPEARVDTPTIL